MEQRWEYCELVIGVDAAGDGSVVFLASEPIIYDIHWGDRYGAVARLGASSWELVASHESSQGRVLYFKRPIQPGRRIDDAF